MGRCPQSGPRLPAAVPASPDRRRTLLLLGAAFGGVVAGGSGGLISCSRTDTASGPPGGSTRVPLSALPPGTRLRVTHHGFPVEIHHRPDGSLAARSLMCTHTGCEVAWNPDRELYFCSCHDGVFGPEGEVLAGPPPRDLPSLEIRLEGDQVVVG